MTRESPRTIHGEVERSALHPPGYRAVLRHRIDELIEQADPVSEHRRVASMSTGRCRPAPPGTPDDRSPTAIDGLPASLNATTA